MREMQGVHVNAVFQTPVFQDEEEEAERGERWYFCGPRFLLRVLHFCCSRTGCLGHMECVVQLLERLVDHGTVAHAGSPCWRGALDCSEYGTPAVAVISLQDPVVMDTDIMRRRSRRTP